MRMESIVGQIRSSYCQDSCYNIIGVMMVVLVDEVVVVVDEVVVVEIVVEVVLVVVVDNYKYMHFLVQS